MQKLKLNFTGEVEEMLSKDQMKKVLGGSYDDGSDNGNQCGPGSGRDCTDPANYWCINGRCVRR